MPGHPCSRPQLFMMVDALPKDGMDDVDMDIKSTEEAIPEISFHVLAGTTHPQTFRVIRKATELPPEVSQLLSDFAHVFEEPIELPPERSHDHRIPLLPNHALVNARPYRYPRY
ncbi:hypothetical protein QYF36_017987 [Acer negundo]|nr:hypothetical protein QYF36_017987 [Acer negundo]